MTISTTSGRAAELTALGYTENPFVAWDNKAATAALGGTTTLAGGDPENAVTGTTSEYWLPDVSGTAANFEIELAAAETLSCVGIAAHNLGTLAASVIVQRSTDGGATWGAASSSVNPTDDKPIVFRMVTTGADAADWRIRISSLTAGDPVYIGVVFFGNDLVFPMRFYSGFSPVLTPTEVGLQSNVSRGNNLLSNSVVTSGSTMQAAFEYLSPTFVRGDFLPFQRDFNAGVPCFFGWRPGTYPEDIHYAWREGDAIRPVNSGTLNLMNLQISMRIFENE